MSPSPKFWDKIAEKYSKQPVADEAVYEEKLRITRGYFQPTMSLLEFGCGTGSTAIKHAPHVQHIRATDISEKMLEIAKRKATAEGIDNITFEQSTVEGFSAPDESYDMILALSLLHLLDDKEAAIDKIRKLLKPGGLFVSSTVCLGDSMKFFKLIGPIGKALGLIPHVDVFTEQELLGAVTGAGFAIDHHSRPGKGKSVFLVASKPS